MARYVDITYSDGDLDEGLRARGCDYLQGESHSPVLSLRSSFMPTILFLAFSLQPLLKKFFKLFPNHSLRTLSIGRSFKLQWNPLSHARRAHTHKRT
jgi:hypothetical protein